MADTYNLLIVKDGGIECSIEVELDSTIRLSVARPFPTVPSEHTNFDFIIHQLLGEPAECFRCGGEISSQLEVVWLDLEQRNDCPDADDLGVPHEPMEVERS